MEERRKTSKVGEPVEQLQCLVCMSMNFRVNVQKVRLCLWEGRGGAPDGARDERWDHRRCVLAQVIG